MEQDDLNTVFEAERAIREMVAAEEQRADGHLACVRQECADLAAREEVRLQGDLAAAVAAVATGEARRRADAILAEAGARAKRLAGLEDDLLKGLLQRGIRSILPGE